MTKKELGVLRLQTAIVEYRGERYFISSLYKDWQDRYFLYLSKKKPEYESQYCIKAPYKYVKIIKQ